MLKFRCLSLAALVTFAASSLTAQTSPAPTTLQMNVTFSGAPPTAPSPGDLTLLDNGAPVAIQSIEKATNSHVIVVLDDVNARVSTIAYERDELQRYLTRNDGRLTVPLAFAVMTDLKTEIQPGFSTDGNAENEVLQKYPIGLHQITRSSQYGGFDRTDIGVRTLKQLVQYATTIPGHKLILFISPGWPLLSGPAIQLSKKEETRILNEVAVLQNAMLRSSITLAMINPFGPGESLLRSDYYQGFLKGVKKPSQVDLADLSLQVMATHSGGFVLQGTSNIAGMFNRSLSDLANAYTVRFQPAPASEALTYHRLQLTAQQPASVRAPDEYYAFPPADAP